MTATTWSTVDDGQIERAARILYDQHRPIYLDEGAWDRAPQWVHDEWCARVRDVLNALVLAGKSAQGATVK